MKTKTDQIVAITDNSRDYLQAIYLDWVNNFLSVEGFASYYSLTHEEAKTLIIVAQRVHDERTS